jgi:hypothetical protein
MDMQYSPLADHKHFFRVVVRKGSRLQYRLKGYNLRENRGIENSSPKEDTGSETC